MGVVETALLSYGPTGLVALIGGIIINKLFNKLSEVQEKRIAEGREGVKAMEQMAAAMDALTVYLRERGRNG